MILDVVKLVEEGKGKFEYSEVVSEYLGHKLYIKVFKDAMKFDDVPELNFRRKVLNPKVKVNGVRLPASADELQQIADLLDCLLLTPKIIDLIWLQALVKFDPVVNLGPGKIVAVQNILDVHQAIEQKLSEFNNVNGLVDSVGKYWVLINDLSHKGFLHGDETACNYGWCASKASGPGILPNVRCWQRPGYKHNKQHLDPSQVIRLMHRKARLIDPIGNETVVDLKDIAQDEKLARLIHHQSGKLIYLRQKGVPERTPLDIINNDLEVKPEKDQPNTTKENIDNKSKELNIFEAIGKVFKLFFRK